MKNRYHIELRNRAFFPGLWLWAGVPDVDRLREASTAVKVAKSRGASGHFRAIRFSDGKIFDLGE